MLSFCTRRLTSSLLKCFRLPCSIPSIFFNQACFTPLCITADGKGQHHNKLTHFLHTPDVITCNCVTQVDLVPEHVADSGFHRNAWRRAQRAAQARASTIQPAPTTNTNLIQTPSSPTVPHSSIKPPRFATPGQRRRYGSTWKPGGRTVATRATYLVVYDVPTAATQSCTKKSSPAAQHQPPGRMPIQRHWW